MDPPRPKLAHKPDPDFSKIWCRKLISRTQSMDFVMDAFLRKGNTAHKVFHKSFGQSNPFFLQELVDGLNMDKDLSDRTEPSEPSVPTDMLDFSCLDKFISFQTSVGDHMTRGNLPPAGAEQLLHLGRPMAQGSLRKQFESTAFNVMQKIVPTVGEVVTSQRSSPDIRAETVDTTVLEITPEVFEDGNVFRLRCQQLGVFRCSLTGLLLEGIGDVVYQIVPWDVGFLSSKGLRPAGPLFRFTLLTGSFRRLHMPHCQLLPDGGQHSLSVAHVTVDNLYLITPHQVTEGHVIIDIFGFSCFGLVTSEESSDAISGLVLLFCQLTDHSLFVLLLPRNICLTQVIKEWKRRNGAEYVEMIPDCQLIPNQSYKLSGQPITFIQPESSKFLNFSDYTNFLPSFQVQLAADVRMVELQLRTHVTPLCLIGCLFGSTGSVVWHRVVQLRAAASALSTEVCVSESVDVTLQLLSILNSVELEDVKTFQRLLSLRSDPIPVSRLEDADRTRTVDLMVQQYQTEGAKQVTEEILRTMSYNQLADQLQKNS